MKSIPNTIIPFLVSVLGLFVGYVIAHPLLFNLCQRVRNAWEQTYCFDASINNVGEPMLLFFMLTTPIALIAIFTKKIGYAFWAKLVILFYGIFFLLILNIDDRNNSGIIKIYNVDIARSLGILFVVISVGIFYFGYLKLKKKGKTT